MMSAFAFQFKLPIVARAMKINVFVEEKLAKDKMLIPHALNRSHMLKGAV